MKREEYCCIIGYQGGEALVDKSSLKKVKISSSKELADQGLYKQAMASAVYAENQEDKEYILRIYKERCSASVETSDQLITMLGIYAAHKDNISVKLI